MGNARLLLAVVFLPLLLAGHAHGQSSCDIEDFKRFDFSSLSQHQVVALLATQSEEVLRRSSKGGRADVIIPKLNVPVGGSYAERQEYASTLASLLRLDTSSQSEAALVRVSLTPSGARAYSDCLRTKDRVSVTYDESVNAWDVEELIVTIHYDSQQRVSRSGRVTYEISGGTVVNGRVPQRMVDESDAIVILRRNGTKALQFAVTVDGYRAQLTLPPRPSHRLVSDTFVSGAVKAISDSHDGHRPDTADDCFGPGRNAAFVPGTAKTFALTRKGEGLSLKGNRAAITSQDAGQVCLTVYADSNSKKTGSVVTAKATGKLVRVVPIQYPSPH